MPRCKPVTTVLTRQEDCEMEEAFLDYVVNQSLKIK